MKVCIIGAGVTGLSLVLLLVNAGISPADITIIDPYFECGDLGRRWGPILSNTPWSKTTDALKALIPSITIPDTSDSTTLLSAIADLFIGLTDPIPVNRIKGYVTEVAYSGVWMVRYMSKGSQSELRVATIILAPGSESKQLNLPLTSIPLECALDPARIGAYVTPGDNVLVFGTMHSGTLVIKNLNDLSANITAVYNSPTPFVWARDGAYDGIKAEAADIADAIVAGTIPVSLVPLSDTAAVIRASFYAKWVIYAMGFTPRDIASISQKYNGATGQIEGATNAWGFGIAYPNSAPDGIHWDVSVAAFLFHMNAQLPTLLQAIR